MKCENPIDIVIKGKGMWVTLPCNKCETCKELVQQCYTKNAEILSKSVTKKRKLK